MVTYVLVAFGLVASASTVGDDWNDGEAYYRLSAFETMAQCRESAEEFISKNDYFVHFNKCVVIIEKDGEEE